MNNFNYFFTHVGPEYKKTFARNIGIGFLILFAIYGAWSLVGDIQEPKVISDDSNIDELIETFKEKYSDREITKFPDSKGIPYKYIVHTEYGDVELLLEKDRVVLKAWKDDGGLCIVSNPTTRDILDNCPLKW